MNNTFIFSCTLGLSVLWVTLAECGCATPDSYHPLPKTDRPNIILIMADDLGVHELGCYGQPHIRTPHIDKLADRGMRFTNFYAGSSVCAPSRSVLMTGLHTGHTTVRGNASGKGQTVDPFSSNMRRVSLEENDSTVAQVLKKAGYVTGAVGKWGIGEPGTSGIPTQKGFDAWLGYLNQNHAPDYYTDYLWENDRKIRIEENEAGKKKVFTHHLFTDFALNFIRDHRQHPFFLYVPFCLPHREFEVPTLGAYADQPWPQEAKTYAAMISELDRSVGLITDQLKKYKLEEKTVVIFTSDNGSEKKPASWNELFKTSNSLRGYKIDLYEGGIRVPFIVSWKGVVSPGRVSEQLGYFADFLPTAAAIAEVKSGLPTDGISLLPVWRDEKKRLADNRFLYWEFHWRGFQQAVRWKNWKALVFYENQAEERTFELYNLAIDPGEQNNLVNEHPLIVDSIKEYLDTARTPSEYWPLPTLDNL